MLLHQITVVTGEGSGGLVRDLAPIISALITVAGVLVVTWLQLKKISKNLNTWVMLYRHDENGGRMEGSIKDLITAIENAYPIKVRIYRENARSDVMDAQWLIVEPERNVVTAQNSSQISMVPKSPDGDIGFAKTPYHFFVLVDTKGKLEAKRVLFDGKVMDRDEDERRSMAWYGLIPPSPLSYLRPM